MSVAVRPLTLADAALPRAGALQNAVLVVLASLLTAAAAQVEIRLPSTPVTITGQSFAVLLAGAVLGPRRAATAMALYLAEGASGLPFFAGGASGAHVFFGPTGGYLLAFPLAAFATGWLCSRAWDRKPLTMFLAMLAGSALILGLGALQLARFVPQGRALALGVMPFLPGDAIKAAIAAGLFPAAWRFVGGPEAK
jgi:biotin transport system substrate-specific component